jgi:hypothetical protein
MGTSASYRSPPTPRWNAVLASYRSGAPLERMTSELFNAAGGAGGWQAVLQGEAVRLYAHRVLSLYDELPVLLRDSESATGGIQTAIDSLRGATLARRDQAGVAIGERALARLLIATVQRSTSLVDASGEEAAQAWTANRPRSKEALLSRYLGEVLRQLCLHLASRDLAGLLGTTFAHAAEASALSRDLGDRAAALVADDQFGPATVEGDTIPAAAWSKAVEQAFARGRILPGRASG